jgi:hypothetical protein
MAKRTPDEPEIKLYALLGLRLPAELAMRLKRFCGASARSERGLLASPEAGFARSTCRCGIDLAALALSDRESASRATVPPRMTRR